MEQYSETIRKTAQKLFDEDRIDLFIGFCRGTEPMRSRPCFVRAGGTEGVTDGGAPEGAAAAAVDDLIWDSFSSNNLAVFLPKLYEKDPHARKGQVKPTPRVGLPVKGCDMRSVIALVKELQVPRDKVFLIGVPCTGMIDRRKAEGRNWTDREEVLQESCLECMYPVPEGADMLLEGEPRQPAEQPRKIVEDFETWSPEERWQYFENEISRCIRCNACRQACPTCYCKVCFAEQSDTKWIGVSTDQSDTMMFHLVRIFHQAGRCVECDACYRACPMGIDLRTFTKKMAKDVEDLFRYTPDFDPEAMPPLSTFTESDTESFITDPDKEKKKER